ncbi:hypothetical protein L0Y97_25785 [Burkholderia multivorans]|uniref:hypothetical protein n=1 Tax=Burkholderia multivorans TaxID=87883 RepID=UPI002019CD83|nr:hypothetical protein [Burkholderia multivorans]MCO1362341.1 hypothetical protein [Burkholderia multivorans]MCO1422112.1 hypothetical protein [Burkholderia multivorans]UQO94627.1 hypothetical protein L0Z41_15740 [Burkholderia multivorans]
MARDLLAVSIGMSQDPVKRNDTTQRVLLVVLIFALIPVVGGVIKGVGRLLLKVTGDVAKDAELLKAVVQFLNRMGHGDAPKWLKALDLAKYQAQVVTRLKDFCATVRVAIQRSLAARVGRMLPDKWRAALERVSSGFHAIQDMADQIVPEAIKELNAKLKVLQNMVYRGEVHEIATGGAPKLEREVEAYLQERRLARDIRRGRFPSAQCLADDGEVEAWLKAKYGPKIAEGWPDILKRKGAMPMFEEAEVFLDVASFSGTIKALTAKELAGKKVYRVFGNVIRSPSGGYIAIDHETLLHDLLWTPTGTSYARRSLVDEAKQHLSSNDLKQFNVELAVASDQHGLGFSVVQVALNQLIDKLYPNAVPALGKGVIGYLSLRSQAGWLANEIGVIA